MSNTREWWDIYVPYNEQSLVCFAIDEFVLQNKMKLANMEICERCNSQIGWKLFKVPGHIMNCQKESEINITEQTTLPIDCPYRLEHIIAFQPKEKTA